MRMPVCMLKAGRASKGAAQESRGRVNPGPDDCATARGAMIDRGRMRFFALPSSAEAVKNSLQCILTFYLKIKWPYFKSRRTR